MSRITIQWWRRRRQDAPLARPAAPTATALTPTSVTLSWAFGGVASHILERSADQAAWTEVYSGSDHTFTSTGLTESTVYYWRVTDVNGALKSEPSPVLSTLTPPTPTTSPAAPAAPTAGTVTTTSVTLTWAAVATATAYTLERALASAPNTWTVRYTGSELAFTDTGLTAGTAYIYRLAATNGAGTSAYSPTRAVTTATPDPVPDAPALPESSNVASTTATVSWTAVTGATSYTLQRSTNQTQWTTAYTGVNRTFAATALAASTTYYWRVSASNTSGTSAYSPIHSFTTRAVATGNVQPFSSKELWMRYGVQTFPHFQTRVYGRDPGAVPAYMGIVVDMGCAYVRMGAGGKLALEGQKEQIAIMQKNDIKFIGTVVGETFAATNAEMATLRADLEYIRDTPAVAKLCIGIESINEPNHNRGLNPPPVPTDWAFRAVEVNRVISEVMRSTSALDHAVRCGPALHDGAAANSYKTMTPAYHAEHGGKQHWHQLVAEGVLDYIDIQVTHSYPSGDVPLTNYVAREELVTSAYGLHPDGSGRNYPMWVNEWGYKNWRDIQYISPEAMQYYDDRAIFIFGIERDVPLSRFELLDDPEQTDVQHTFGIVASHSYDPALWVNKPSVRRIKAVLQELKDPGPDYQPDKITLTVDKNGNNSVHWHVTAKRDGSATLWAWNDNPVWDKGTKTMINVPDVTITVTDSIGTRQLAVGKDVRSYPVGRR